MSKENVRLFFEQVKSDKKLQEKLMELSKEQHEKLTKNIVEFAAEVGYPFSQEEMKQLEAEELTAMSESSELLAEEMGDVVGGSPILKPRPAPIRNSSMYCRRTDS